MCISNERVKSIKVKAKWRDITVVSDCYVILGTFGYAAVVDVLEGDATERRRMFIGPKTLAEKLELLRAKNDGKFKGLRFRLRKESEDRKSAYQVKKPKRADR